MKRGIQSETPSGKKAKGDQYGQSVSFSGPEESSGQESSSEEVCQFDFSSQIITIWYFVLSVAYRIVANSFTLVDQDWW